MRLYIIRHADPDYAHDAITEAGHLEARALADRMATERLDRIFCSPLGRARLTMHYTADRLGLSAEIQEWMQELSGMRIQPPPWGDLAAWDVPGEIFQTHRVAEAFAGQDFSAQVQTVHQGSDQFLARLGYVRQGGLYQCVRPHAERIAVFCHNGLGLTWLAHLLQLPLVAVWTSFWLAPTSVTTVLLEQRSTEWAVPRCLAVGDTSHLYQAGLPIRPRGIKANFD